MLAAKDVEDLCRYSGNGFRGHRLEGAVRSSVAGAESGASSAAPGTMRREAPERPLIDFDLGGDSLGQLRDVEMPPTLALGLKVRKGVEGDGKRLGVEAAEAFVDEQGLDAEAIGGE